MGKDVIERESDQAYNNCKGVGRTLDDVQVSGNEEKHMTELHEETGCTRKRRIKHYFDKCLIQTKCCSL